MTRDETRAVGDDGRSAQGMGAVQGAGAAQGAGAVPEAASWEVDPAGPDLWRQSWAGDPDRSGAPAATLIVGLFADGSQLAPGAGAEAVRQALGVDVVRAARSDPEFHGRSLEKTTVVLEIDGAPARISVVGLGARGGATRTTVFEAALAVAVTDGPVVTTLALELEERESGAAAAIEGHALGAWRYRPPGPEASGRPPASLASGRPSASPGPVRSRQAGRLTVWVPETTARVREEVERGAIVSSAANWVRQLVETPPNLLGPAELARAIADFAEATAPGMSVSIWDEAALAERGFGATLGVGSGSVRRPCAVELDGGPDGPVIALAGKGITFDAGGINLKRDGAEIAWMKSDMAAAASVAAAAIVSVALGAPRHLHVLLPIADNMPGGGAGRPGDVVRHPDGRTTEVVDTDCEGRLVLADAIAWLASTAPHALIDVGTLTDAGGVGPAFWGCWATAPGIANALVNAGARVCDPGWRLPLHDSYRAWLASRVADAANTSTEVPDTAVLAATYLRPFARDVPWVHIDNGSSAWLERDEGPWRAGPTAAPMRALVEFLVGALEDR